MTQNSDLLSKPTFDPWESKQLISKYFEVKRWSILIT